MRVYQSKPILHYDSREWKAAQMLKMLFRHDFKLTLVEKKQLNGAHHQHFKVLVTNSNVEFPWP